MKSFTTCHFQSSQTKMADGERSPPKSNGPSPNTLDLGGISNFPVFINEQGKPVVVCLGEFYDELFMSRENFLNSTISKSFSTYGHECLALLEEVQSRMSAGHSLRMKRRMNSVDSGRMGMSFYRKTLQMCIAVEETGIRIKLEGATIDVKWPQIAVGVTVLGLVGSVGAKTLKWV